MKRILRACITKLLMKNEYKLGYISTKQTVEAAQKMGLSVCDYVERMWNIQGTTQGVIDKLQENNVFSISNPNILEVGAGTGRYIEKFFQKCNPSRYEIYETAKDWADWLSKQYKIISCPADGQTLNKTLDNSMDIIHAHGVFVYLPFLTAYSYWKEFWRVAKVGSFVVFDFFSEKCMQEPSISKWLASKDRYPVLLPAEFTISSFKKKGFEFCTSFTTPNGHDFSEYYVFKRIKVI